MFLGAGPFVSHPLVSTWSGVYARGISVNIALFDIVSQSDGMAVQPTLCAASVAALADIAPLPVSCLSSVTTVITMADLLGTIARLDLLSEVSLTDSATTAFASVLTTTEILSGAASVEFQHSVASALLERLALRDLVGSLADLSVEETLAAADQLALAIAAELASDEMLALREVLRHALVLICPETFELREALAQSVSAAVMLQDGVVFIANLPLDDGDYQAWVMNADTTGVTSYSHFPMDSLFTHDGVPYGLTSAGLYRLEGDDDDGAAISAMVATGDLDFGTSRLKNIPRAYLYITQAGACVLKTITSVRGARHETYYEMADRATDGDDDNTYRRVPLGRGVRGVWWRFEVHNVDGSDFILDGAEVLPVVLSRRG